MMFTTLAENGIFYALTGAFAGLMSGILGIGGVFFAPIGARLSYVLPVLKLKYAFTAVLLLAAIDLLV